MLAHDVIWERMYSLCMSTLALGRTARTDSWEWYDENPDLNTFVPLSTTTLSDSLGICIALFCCAIAPHIGSMICG